MSKDSLRRHAFAAVLALAALALSENARGADEIGLDAPYQVVALSYFRSDQDRADTGLGLTAPYVIVDLGNAEKRPPPAREGLETMTLLGTGGSAPGRLYDIRKTCNFLCGDEGEACHYEALYSLPQAAVARLGTPLVALAGEIETGNLRAFSDQAARPAKLEPPANPAAEFRPPLWTADPDAAPRYRVTAWDGATGALAMEFRYRDQPANEVLGRNCRAQGLGVLTALSCDGMALLVDDSRVLLFSWPDYNLAAAAPVLAFEAAGASHYLVRLGLKAQTVFGLLTGGSGGWRGAFRPRDYDLLC
jgi:hypothetical protein